MIYKEVTPNGGGPALYEDICLMCDICDEHIETCFGSEGELNRFSAARQVDLQTMGDICNTCISKGIIAAPQFRALPWA